MSERRFVLRTSALLMVGIATITSCGKVRPSFSEGVRCSLNSDCASPLVCGFERCRAECRTSRDCPGGLCVRGASSNTCQLPDEVTCTHDSQCAGSQVCASDRRCRDECSADKDCVAELVCVDRVCAKPEELTNGRLPRASAVDAGVRCTYASDCPLPLVCLYNRCDVECLGDKDCFATWICRTQKAGGDGRCYPGGNVPDASVEASVEASVDAMEPASRIHLSGSNSTTCATFDGKVKCWGYNVYGSLGLGDTQDRGGLPNQMGAALPFLALGTGRTTMALSESGLCALLDNSMVKCWGFNTNGRLGIGDVESRGDDPGEMGDALPAVNLGVGRTVKAIGAGSQHTCAILDTGGVKCWGANSFGQLGLGDTASRGGAPGQLGDTLPFVNLGTGRTAKAITLGLNHSCAILDNDKVKCWGLNVSGQLGLGDTVNRGDGPNEMGDNLPYVDLGTGRTASRISSSNLHTCAVLDNGKLKCWGRNVLGELGLGDTINRGDGANEMGDNLAYVDVGAARTVRSVSAGTIHTCAVLDNRAVKCWGANGSGQLGLGDKVNRGTAAGQMGDALPEVSLGTGRTAFAVTAASQSCVVLDNDRVKCFGDNSTGSLGLGDTQSRGGLPNQMGDNLPYVDLAWP